MFRLTQSSGALSPQRGWQIALGVQAAAAQAAWQGVRLMLAYQAFVATGSPVFVGVVAAVFALAGLLVSIPSGRLVDRYGGVRLASGAMVVCLMGVGVALIFPTIPGLLVTATLVGSGQIYVIVAQQGMVARLTSGSPDAAFGTLTAAAAVGQLIGPPLVTAASIAGVAAGDPHPNTQLGLACCGLLFGIGLPTFFVLRPAEIRAGPPRRTDTPASLQKVLRAPGMVRALLVGATVIVTVDLLASFIPVWAVANHIPVAVVGWLLALRALFTIGSRFGVARLVDLFGRKILLIVTLGSAVLALFLLPFADAWWAIPIMAVIGVGLGMPQPLTLVWMSALAPPSALGTAFGARMTVNRLAQVTVPLLVATITGPAGVIAVFWTTATILASGVMMVGLTRASALNQVHGPPDHIDRTPDVD